MTKTSGAAGRHRTIWIVALCAAAAAVTLLVLRQRGAQEAVAIGELRQLGALVVLDGNRKHAASVNLSTVSGTEQLRQAVLLLPRLSRIASFDASRTAVSDRDLETIGRLTSLTALTLVHTDISDDGLHHLARLGGLEALYLMETRVTRDSLTSLATHRRLRILDISHTQVAGDISPLAGLPDLEWLLLRGISLDQQGLAGLATAPKLRQLNLEGSQYDPSWLEPLRALPDLRISE